MTHLAHYLTLTLNFMFHIDLVRSPDVTFGNAWRSPNMHFVDYCFLMQMYKRYTFKPTQNAFHECLQITLLFLIQFHIDNYIKLNSVKIKEIQTRQSQCNEIVHVSVRRY